MGKALYRKYRSRSFDEVVGQDHIVKTLTNAIKDGRISHAYLFSGPRGVGKTSVARVLAHEVNGLDYSDESIHLDIIEIDAASNRRIDEIRDLRDKVHIAPTSAKYKVYIIDEVHMLTREAFNALLKTLEEPPAHCIFILATTEAHKLPETIISRTQHFNFKPIAPEAAADHLATVAKDEKIDIEPKALELLAKFGEGSLRDSLSLLDQLSSAGKVTEQAVLDALGVPPSQAIDDILANIAAGNSQKLLAGLEKLQEQGANPAILAKNLSAGLRTKLLAGDAAPWISHLLKELLSVPGSPAPQDSLEIALLEAAAANSDSTAQSPATLVQSEAMKEPEPEPVAEPEPQDVEEPAPAEGKDELQKPAKSEPFSLEHWPDVLAKIQSDNPGLYRALRLAEARLGDEGLTLAFQFPLHQKKVDTKDSKKAIQDAISQVAGSNVKVTCVVDKTLKPVENSVDQPLIPSAAPPDETIQTISNIFGATELIES